MLLAGAQALIVGALLAVIYFTLLKPDDDGTLFGVDAPQDRPRVVQKPPQDGERDRGDRRAERVREPGAAPGPRGRLVGFGPAPGVAPGPGQGPPGGDGGPPEEGDSPTDDQYQGTLARLEAMLDAGP